MGTKYERENLNMFFQSMNDRDSYFKINKKNALILISDGGDFENIQKIADNFILIKDMHIIPSSSAHRTYCFDFSIRGEKGIYSFKYSNGKLRSKSIISALNYRGVDIINKNLFLSACRLYCIYYIKSLQFKHVCGWIKRNHELFYVGISEDHESNDPDISDYFLTNYMYDKKDYDYTEQEYADYLASLLNLTNKDITFPLLGYVFLSFSYILVEKYISFPFLNICQKNRGLTPNILTNLYANVFARDFDSITSIDKYFCLNINNGKKKAEEYLVKYSDCPIIVVTNRNSNIPIKSGTGMFIIDYIKNNDIRIFPIFLTKKPINNDQLFIVLKLENSKFQKEAYDFLIKALDIMSALIEDFIEFISCGENMQELSRKILETAFIKIHVPYISNKNLYKLYTPLNYGIHMLMEFCITRSIVSKKQAADILNEANGIFKSLSYSDDLPASMIADKSVALFIDYVSKIFISNKIKPNYLFWDGKDRNSRIMCYFLEYDSYYNDFAQTYLPEQVLGQREFESALESFGIIKTYNDRPQTYKPREHNGKTHKVLVIVQDAIHKPANIADI